MICSYHDHFLNDHFVPKRYDKVPIVDSAPNNWSNLLVVSGRGFIGTKDDNRFQEEEIANIGVFLSLTPAFSAPANKPLFIVEAYDDWSGITESYCLNDFTVLDYGQTIDIALNFPEGTSKATIKVAGNIYRVVAFKQSVFFGIILAKKIWFTYRYSPPCPSFRCTSIRDIAS